MKSHVLYSAVGALWGALVFFVAFLFRNAIGDGQTLGDQSVMLVGMIVIGAIALPASRARRSRDVDNPRPGRPERHSS